MATHDLTPLRCGGRLAIEAGRAGVTLKQHGREYEGLCPFHEERTPSFRVYTDKSGVDKFKCFGCGAQGDVIEFIQRLYKLTPGAAIARLLAETTPVNAPRAPDKTRQAVRREGDDFAYKAALSLIESGVSGHKGIATYLKHRGIDVARIGGIPNALRFHPDVLHLAQQPDSRPPIRSHHPAMLAPIHAVNGKFLGVHRTYLRSDCTGKAAVSPAKMVLGGMRGGCIRLCAPEATLALAEGIETALSVRAATGLAVWSVVSLGNFQNVLLPASVREVILLGDADCKVDVRAKLTEAAHKLRSHSMGRKVRIAMAAPGMDFNDMIRVGAP